MEEKIELKEIDRERWQFILYENSNNDWICDYVYSPQSYMDLSMLIKLTSEEVDAIKVNREVLLELSESIRNDFRNYLVRALDRNNYIFRNK